MTAAGSRPSGVLVSGVIDNDTWAIGAALEALGLTALGHDDGLDDLARRVLRAAGGSRIAPPHVAVSELARVDAALAAEARQFLHDATDGGRDPAGPLWVWADPRHSLLAPFWQSALDQELAIVHVHNDPGSVVSALGHEQGLAPDAALRLWEWYNRAALVPCTEWQSLLVGDTLVRTDPERCAATLAEFVERWSGAVEQRDVTLASNAIRKWAPDPPNDNGGAVALSPSIGVLDAVLSDLENQVHGEPNGTPDTASAFAHLSDFYDAEYYRDYDGGTPYNRVEPHWVQFFGEVADNIVATLAPRHVFDAGCAIGLLVEALRERGVDASGIDLSAWAIGQVPSSIRPYCRVGSITDPITGHFDLITCIEVLEHLPASDADRAIENLCAHTDAILFSSTPEEFDDPTHLHVESTGYWAKIFAQYGFFRDFDHNASYVAPHAVLFRRAAPDTKDLVWEYERSLWRTRGMFSDVGRALERGWKESATRVEDLEKLFNAQYSEVADERTVAALERLIASTNVLRSSVSGPPVLSESEDPARWIADDYDKWRAARVVPDAPDHGPSFSIVVPVFNPEAEHLTACIRSVRAQTYQNWELVLVDVSSAAHVRPICNRFRQLDPRVQILRRENTGIAENSNAGVRGSNGDYVVFLDHDDTLEPHALAALALYVENRSEADLVYSDEDKIDPEGNYTAPFFKPDWSPDLLRSVNYVCHLVAVRRSLFEKVGGLRRGFEGAQDYDFVLRATAEARHVGHVADVLYHWRLHPGSTASDVRVKPDAHSAGRRALQSFSRRYVPGAWVEPGADLSAHRVRYPLRYEKVSLVIPFRDQATLTDACLRSLSASMPILPLEVLLVSNGSSETATFEFMERWEREFNWARTLEFDEPFNFQRLNNWAAAQADGPLLLFLNNDVEALHAGWLEALAEHAQRPEVGAVGARLFYPDGLIQHAGVSVGIGGLADHPWAGLHPEAWTPAGPSWWTRDFLAVTAACMMIDHEKFDEVGGFDERFTVCGGDVDLGLRLHERGLWNVMTPYARLIHRESATRRRIPPASDVVQSHRAYAPYLRSGDPFFNPNLTRADRSCRIAPGSAPDHEVLSQ